MTFDPLHTKVLVGYQIAVGDMMYCTRDVKRYDEDFVDNRKQRRKLGVNPQMKCGAVTRTLHSAKVILTHCF